MRNRRLIVNADDFGLTEGVNAGIVEAFQKGVLRSASLMANGEYRHVFLIHPICDSVPSYSNSRTSDLRHHAAAPQETPQFAHRIE